MESLEPLPINFKLLIDAGKVKDLFSKPWHGVDWMYERTYALDQTTDVLGVAIPTSF